MFILNKRCNPNPKRCVSYLSSIVLQLDREIAWSGGGMEFQ